MRFIPTRIHGLLDYLLAIVLIASPWIFGFQDGGIKMWLPVVLGIVLAAYSFLTDYELGLARILPMPAHLTLDFLSGVLLAVSPWLFGFSDEVKWPHLILGLLEIGAALMTQHHPSYEGDIDVRPQRRNPHPA